MDLYQNLLEVMDTDALEKWGINGISDLEKLNRTMSGGRRKRKTRRRV
jgi:hypothetical protein